MKSWHGGCIVICCICIFSQAASAQPFFAGIIKSVSGEVVISNGKSSMNAVTNMKFFEGDTIKTGGKGSTGLIFEDDTVVSLGPESEMVVQHFRFNPVEKELSFVARLLRGTFSFITGQIAKLASQNVRLETPDATLGVRGTKFIVKID